MAELTYTTRDGDVLDAVVYRHYGRTTGRVVETVLDRNPSVTDYGAVLPAGVTIVLPDIEEAQQVATVRLWD